MTVILVVLALLLLIVGVLGTIFPAVPGLPLMFFGAWLLADAHDYEVLGIVSLFVILFLTILGMLMDFLAGWFGAKYTRASKWALWGAFWGGLVGLFFAIWGVMLGPLIGAAIGEWLAKRDLMIAGKVGLATFVGVVLGTVAKIGMALSIVLIIVVSYITYWFI